MEINEEILEIFKEVKIYPADGICYLIAVFYGYKPHYIPADLKVKVNASGIYGVKGGNLHWNVPLFKNQETGFDWVKTEYVQMFKEHNPTRGGHVREATARMKRLFAKNPDIRKDDIIGATRMYLINTDSQYIRNPHFFIEKGTGGNKTTDILDWIDKHKENVNRGQGRVSHTNTLR
jgi:hypothetical protein